MILGLCWAHMQPSEEPVWKPKTPSPLSQGPQEREKRRQACSAASPSRGSWADAETQSSLNRSWKAPNTVTLTRNCLRIHVPKPVTSGTRAGFLLPRAGDKDSVKLISQKALTRFLKESKGGKAETHP